MHPKRLDITDEMVAEAVLDFGYNGAALELGCTTGLIKWRLLTMRRENKLLRGPASQYDKHIDAVKKAWDKFNNIVKVAKHCNISKTTAHKYLHRFWKKDPTITFCKKITDARLKECWAEAKTVRGTARLAGISHPSVLYRLRRLGIKSRKV